MRLHCITNCHILSFGEGAKRPLGWANGFVFEGENERSRHQHLFQENIRKTKMDKGLRILKMRVREFFTDGEGISTPRARHKGLQPLIECANHDFKLCIFPFYVIFSLLCFLTFVPFMFFTFLGSTRVFPSLLCIPQLR